MSEKTSRSTMNEYRSWSKLGVCLNLQDNIKDFWISKKDLEIGQAKIICETCPVIKQCLAYALDNHEEEGVWGGTTPEERKALKEEEELSDLMLAS